MLLLLVHRPPLSALSQSNAQLTWIWVDLHRFGMRKTANVPLIILQILCKVATMQYLSPLQPIAIAFIDSFRMLPRCTVGWIWYGFYGAWWLVFGNVSDCGRFSNFPQAFHVMMMMNNSAYDWASHRTLFRWGQMHFSSTALIYIEHTSVCCFPWNLYAANLELFRFWIHDLIHNASGWNFRPVSFKKRKLIDVSINFSITNKQFSSAPIVALLKTTQWKWQYNIIVIHQSKSLSIMIFV